MRCRHVLVVLVCACLVVGCESEEPAPAPPEAAAPPVVSPAHRQALVEMVEQAPADAVLVGVLRSPRAVVDGLNEFAGPELATLASVGLAMLPTGAVDMEKPFGWTVWLSGQGPPHLVFLAHVADADRLAGLTVEEGIKRLPPPGPGRPAFFAMQKEGRVVLALSAEALTALRSAEARFETTNALADRMAANLVWMHLRAGPLADLARPPIQQARQEAEGRAAGEGPSKEVRFFEWLEDLLDQTESLEVALSAGAEAGALHAGMTFREDASALALARSLKPIEAYEAGLPRTDRFFSASWVRMDHAEAGERLREFLGPPVEMLLAKLDEAIAAAGQPGPTPPGEEPAGPGGPPKGLSEFGEAVKDLWSLVDDQAEALGAQTATLAEIPEPGQGLYATTTVYTVKDTAAFRAMVEKGVSAAKGVIDFVLGQAAEQPGGPKMTMDLDYTQGAETIEDVSVDVIRFDLDIQPPPGVPPEVQDVFTSFMDQIYGPEGLTARVAVCNGRAVVTLGPKEVMARALRHLRDGGEDLATQPAVRRALARAPEGSRYVGLVSLPGYAYTLSRVYGDAFSGMLARQGGISFEGVPMPKADMPAIGEPVLLAMGVEDRTVRLTVDVPASDLSRSILPLRHAMSRLMLFAFQSAFGAAMQQANSAAFVNNLGQLAMMAQHYAASHRQTFPSADGWLADFKATTDNLDDLLTHPGRPGDGRAVAMNAAMGGIRLTDVRQPRRTVLFFECRPGAPPAGGPEHLPETPTGGGGYVVAFCDGHVETVSMFGLDSLVWTPGGP